MGLFLLSGGCRDPPPPVQGSKNKNTTRFRPKYGLECLIWGFRFQIFSEGACPRNPLENISVSCGVYKFLQKSASPPPSVNSWICTAAELAVGIFRHQGHLKLEKWLLTQIQLQKYIYFSCLWKMDICKLNYVNCVRIHTQTMLSISVI